MEELDHYTGKVWTHILSLKRKDATRLDCDNAKVWMNLLRTNHNDIAAMNIPPNHFRWYAAFHDEVKHPHVHMMAWSAVPGEAYLTREGIRKIKSTLTNQIFRQEMLHTYEQKSQSQDEVVREARQTIRKLPQEMARTMILQKMSPPKVPRTITPPRMYRWSSPENRISSSICSSLSNSPWMSDIQQITGRTSCLKSDTRILP